jgi:PAS domain S-box-containing protein/putative nucleotidyltransferase with HDIG domain
MGQEPEQKKGLKILHLEDSVQDFEIIREMLVDTGGDLQIDRVESENDFVSALKTRGYDLILADFRLPGFDAFGALRLAVAQCPEVPFVCVSGSIGEETAIELIKGGAVDYVLKDRPERLPFAIERALKEAREKEGRRKAEEALRESDAKYRLIADNSDDWVYWIAPDGTCRYSSPSCERVTGYPAEEFMARPQLLREIVYPEDMTLMAQHGAAAQETGPDILEFRITTRAGEVRYIAHSCSPVYAEDGGYAGRRATNRDITRSKKAEDRVRQTLEALKKTLEGTIRVISQIVETRDPYTAGHQRRVASLAEAMAMEMGLPEETVDLIRMAAVIHDIGKIAVPAEILIKPTRLNDLEMGLVRVHSRAGYDILKDSELPRSMAEIVLQHHERLDGSGYPQRLEGSDVLPEAQILAVADVVEAISSHRPYRPSLGVDAALDEIERNRGILYSPEATDACLRLFRERGFSFT